MNNRTLDYNILGLTLRSIILESVQPQTRIDGCLLIVLNNEQ
ncbi:hypothetical protein Ple7327_2573 [Pleurocapsa sp. PCC 7327]|nr:hypothetical protein Ple7327_2573 [Pleurocapsa sp. PCC 7327]